MVIGVAAGHRSRPAIRPPTESFRQYVYARRVTSAWTKSAPWLRPTGFSTARRCVPSEGAAPPRGRIPPRACPFYHALMVRCPSGALSELAFVGTRREILRGFAEPSPSFERTSCRLYSPCRSHLYRRDSIGPLDGSCMNASFARHAQRPARGSARPRLLRLMIVIAAILIVSVLPATVRANNSETRPTIVLVHGAWASPPGWDMVVAGLQKDGFTTVTPMLGLLSIAEDVAIVRAVLDAISGPKILVGHSYGGIVISNAAYGRSDVLGLVFTAAFVPEQGESIFSLGADFHTSEAFNHFIWTGTPFASPAFIDPAFFAQFFCQDLNPNLEATLNAEQIPLNFSIAPTPSGPVAWHTLPSWYAISGKDLMIDPAEELFMAQRAGATTIVFPAASHAGGITHYATGF